MFSTEFIFSWDIEKFSKPKRHFLLKSTKNLLKRIENHFNIFSFQINSESSKNIDFLLKVHLVQALWGGPAYNARLSWFLNCSEGQVPIQTMCHESN